MTNLPTTSPNSQIASQKQSNLFRFIKTNEELQIAQSVEQSELISNLNDLTPLLQVISKWRVYVGVPKGDVAEELAIITEFIYKNFGHLTIKELELAINLSVLRKLDDVDFFGSFSVMYVGKVLESYLYYRKRTMADAIRRMEKDRYEELEKKSRPTPEQESELTKEIISDFYKQYKEEGQITDILNICWFFFRKHKWLNPTRKDYDDAMDWANKQYDKLNKGFFSRVEDNKEQKIKILARNYCVQNYFSTIDINVVLKNIKPELFA